MLKNHFTALVVSAFCLCGTALAEPVIIETQPVEGDPFRDFRVEECDDVFGVLMMNYDTITEMSDFCLNEAEGTMVSSETRTGFVLAEDSTQGRAFEILETGDDKWSRVRVDVGHGGIWCIPSDTTKAVSYSIPDRKTRPSNIYAEGYTVPDRANVAQEIVETNNAYLGIRNFSNRRGSDSHVDAIKLPLGADMLGIVTAQGETASFSISQGNGDWVGAAEGDLKITLGKNNEITVRGNFVAKNHRLVGHEPHEWIEMTASIPYMRGHIFGESGEMINAIGIVRGSYKDASGLVHEFEASATLSACRPK